MDKCFTVCFDQRYLEPALLTAWELIAHQCVPLYLVYVAGLACARTQHPGCCKGTRLPQGFNVRARYNS
jgi:hypothetical protein